MKTLQTSVVASAALAMGRAFVVSRAVDSVAHIKGTEEEERELFTNALSVSRAQIESLATDSDIFAAHLEMIDDDMLSESVLSKIAEG